jgi:hypothetical protein
MTRAPGRDVSTPDGIRDEHIRPSSGLGRHASPLSLAVFGSVIVLGLTGLLGHERNWQAAANGTELAVHAPAITRNGEFLEMRISVETDEPIGELVIGVESALWEDLTLNTMIPAPTDEDSEAGEFRFTFTGLEPGMPFLLKIDLQINPDIVGGNDGTVAVYDGDERLVETPISITVLP